jgi:hypothetical protein
MQQYYHHHLPPLIQKPDVCLIRTSPRQSTQPYQSSNHQPPSHLHPDKPLPQLCTFFLPSFAPVLCLFEPARLSILRPFSPAAPTLEHSFSCQESPLLSRPSSTSFTTTSANRQHLQSFSHHSHGISRPCRRPPRHEQPLRSVQARSSWYEPGAPASPHPRRLPRP